MHFLEANMKSQQFSQVNGTRTGLARIIWNHNHRWGREGQEDLKERTNGEEKAISLQHRTTVPVEMSRN